jgi:hypothetical protein
LYCSKWSSPVSWQGIKSVGSLEAMMNKILIFSIDDRTDFLYFSLG